MSIVESTIIDYKNAPDGKAFIGFAKKPLMPNKNKIGFQGVKIMNLARTLIQCNECGEWREQLNNSHFKSHGFKDIFEYKKKYGYNRQTALISDSLSLKLAEGLRSRTQLFGHRFTDKDRAKGFALGKKGKLSSKRTREWQNSKGTCPEQLKDRLVNFVHRYHRLPTKGSKYDGYPFSSATYFRRYGGLNKAFKEFGLPFKTNLHATRGMVSYQFPDGSIYKMPYGENYEQFYLLMKEKCPVLKKI